MAIVAITDIYTDYIIGQILSTNMSRVKRTLQEICYLYRRGYRFPARRRPSVETAILGALQTAGKSDKKVRRWAIISLAYCGTKVYSFSAILACVKPETDPDTLVAAIAALYRLEHDTSSVTALLNKIQPALCFLAGIQSVPIEKLPKNVIPLPYDRCVSDLLKLSLVAVGLDKAPPNLFDPRHENREIVRELGGHDDPLVCQYTVWAVAENKNLAVRDLGIPMDEIGNLPNNVRGWMYRAACAETEFIVKNQDLLRQGISEDDSDIRWSMAAGLGTTYFDGLEETTTDWLFSESNEDVRMRLLEHMVKNSANFEGYQDIVLEIWKSESLAVRSHIEAFAPQTPIFARLRRLQIGADVHGDLFGGSHVTNINISGSVGAFSMSGNAESQGAVINVSPEISVKIVAAIPAAVEELKSIANNNDEAKQAIKELEGFEASPTKTAAQKIFRRLGWIIENTSGLGQGIGGIATLAELLSHAA